LNPSKDIGEMMKAGEDRTSDHFKQKTVALKEQRTGGNTKP
jgi:hypothetical protein